MPSRVVLAFITTILIVTGAYASVSEIIDQSSAGSTQIASSSTSSASTTSIASIQGLELRLADNATILDVGQRLNVNISLINTLQSTNTFATVADWSFHGVPAAMWPGCYTAAPVQVAILNGSYTSENLPFNANATFPYTCAEGGTVDHVIFQPASDQTNLTGFFCSLSCAENIGPFHLSLNFTLSGYWDIQSLSKELQPLILGPDYNPVTSIPFVSGVYTVAVGDEWGQAAILHFTVVSASNPSASGSPAEVVSLTGPIPPYTPAGPEVGVTLRNIGQVPITSLNASLGLPGEVSSPYSFVFDVSSSSPLLPGQSIQATRTLVNGGFDSTQEYPLTISGALSNGTRFAYAVQVQIVSPSG
jgi:hypothetical protein